MSILCLGLCLLVPLLITLLVPNPLHCSPVPDAEHGGSANVCWSRWNRKLPQDPRSAARGHLPRSLQQAQFLCLQSFHFCTHLRDVHNTETRTSEFWVIEQFWELLLPDGPVRQVAVLVKMKQPSVKAKLKCDLSRSVNSTLQFLRATGRPALRLHSLPYREVGTNPTIRLY